MDLKNLKVSHNISDFTEGKEIILTLKDSNILTDNNELNDEEDILENVEMSEADQRELNKLAAKKGYNVYEEIETGDTSDVLKKYDEVNKKQGFRLEGTVTSTLSKEERLAEVRKKLGVLSKNKTPIEPKQMHYSLDNISQPVNGFLPQTFKKRRKKKKTNSKRQQVIDIQSNNTNLMDISKEEDKSEEHHGSRKSDQLKQQKMASLESFQKQNKIKAYEKAIAKAKMESFALLDESNDHDDNEIYESLKKSRASVRKINPSDTISVAEQIKNRKQIKSQNIPSKGVVFTSTGEFCRNIEPITEKRKKIEPQKLQNNNKSKPPTQSSSTNHQKVDKMEIDEPVDTKVNVKQENSKSSATFDNIKKEKIHSDDEDNDPLALMVEEPLASDGIIATLKLMKQTGDFSNADTMDIYSGRQTDEKISEDPDDPAPDINLNHYDENGRILTMRERFRILSYAFHGQGPGLNKLEKENRKKREILKMYGMESETHAETAERVKQEQERTGQPFVELSAQANPKESQGPSALLGSNSSNSTEFHEFERRRQPTAAKNKTGKIEFGFTGKKRKPISDDRTVKRTKYQQ